MIFGLDTRLIHWIHRIVDALWESHCELRFYRCSWPDLTIRATM